jgi:hypothetical protein
MNIASVSRLYEQESNPGPLGVKSERYLSAIPHTNPIMTHSFYVDFLSIKV